MDRRLSPPVVGGVLSGGVLLLALLAVVAFVVRDAEPDRITGDAAVDSIISAVERQDLVSLLERVAYQQVPCSDEPEPDPVTQLEPPLCPAGLSHEALVEVFMSGNCEGHWVTNENLLGEFADRLGDPQQVYAVVLMDQPFTNIVAQYRIVFGRLGEPEFPFSGQIAVFDGTIVQLTTWCQSAPGQLLALQAAGGEPVFVSPDLDPVASAQSTTR